MAPRRPLDAAALPAMAAVRVITRAAAGSAPVVAVCLVQAFAPRPWQLLRFAALLAHRGLRRRALLLCGAATGAPQQQQAQPGSAADVLLALPQLLFEPLAPPCLFFLVAPPVLSWLAPPLVRTAVFYRHMAPVVVGYMRTLFLDAPAAARHGGDDAGQAVWDARHEWGAQRMHAMLTDLSGFYVKVRRARRPPARITEPLEAHAQRSAAPPVPRRALTPAPRAPRGRVRQVGQVFATKAELVPAAYPRRLRALFDACQPAPWATVRRTIERELGAPLETLFAFVDPKPLATATIAQVRGAARRSKAPLSRQRARSRAPRRRQVHRGRLHDGREIVVKVQHEGMEARRPAPQLATRVAPPRFDSALTRCSTRLNPRSA